MTGDGEMHSRRVRMLGLPMALGTALVAVMSCGNDETKSRGTASTGGSSGTGGVTGQAGSGPSRASGGTTSATGGSGGGVAQTGGSAGIAGGAATAGSGGAGTAGGGSGGVAGEGNAGTSGGGGEAPYFCATANAGAAGIGGAGGTNSGGDVIGGAGGTPGTNLTAACYGPLMGGEGGRSYSPVRVGECIVSGAVTNFSPRGEEPRRAFDGLTGPPPDQASKWLTFWAPIDGVAPVESGDSQVWIQVQLPAAAAEKIVTHYALVSSNDRYRRDPSDWQLLASHNGTDWQAVDTRCRITWPDVAANPPDYDKEQERKRYFRLFFKVATPGAYTYYRLLIGNNSGDRDPIVHNGITSIGEMELYAVGP